MTAGREGINIHQSLARHKVNAGRRCRVYIRMTCAAGPDVDGMVPVKTPNTLLFGQATPIAHPSCWPARIITSRDIRPRRGCQYTRVSVRASFHETVFVARRFRKSENRIRRVEIGNGDFRGPYVCIRFRDDDTRARYERDGKSR